MVGRSRGSTHLPTTPLAYVDEEDRHGDRAVVRLARSLAEFRDGLYGREGLQRHLMALGLQRVLPERDVGLGDADVAVAEQVLSRLDADTGFIEKGGGCRTSGIRRRWPIRDPQIVIEAALVRRQGGKAE